MSTKAFAQHKAQGNTTASLHHQHHQLMLSCGTVQSHEQSDDTVVHYTVMYTHTPPETVHTTCCGKQHLHEHGAQQQFSMQCHTLHDKQSWWKTNGGSTPLITAALPVRQTLDPKAQPHKPRTCSVVSTSNTPSHCTPPRSVHRGYIDVATPCTI